MRTYVWYLVIYAHYFLSLRLSISLRHVKRECMRSEAQQSEWMSSSDDLCGLDYITASPPLHRDIINQEKSQKSHMEVVCVMQGWILIAQLKTCSHQKRRNSDMTKWSFTFFNAKYKLSLNINANVLLSKIEGQ